MPWLVQYGPRSLSFIKKKSDVRKIVHENLILKDKIEKAKSSVRIDELLRHQEMVTFSCSLQKFDSWKLTKGFLWTVPHQEQS